MKISVAYATPEKQAWLQLDVENDCTVNDAISQSGILTKFPDIDLDNQKVGIFGKITKLDTALSEGDRIEIYRKIIADPKKVPRKNKVDDEDDDDDE
jgi:putative ubiquitin-RnfH superfamily antitoxin RatB of RatAB toxin-antitoxin module